MSGKSTVLRSLAFKANIDDMREAFGRLLIAHLQAIVTAWQGFRVPNSAATAVG